MAEELIDKVAIVTGGASGIGRATVELFAQAGARVVIADVGRERGEAVARQLGSEVAFKQTDVTSADQVQKLIDFTVARFGRLDVMFNNAGIPGDSNGLFADDPLEDFHEVMSVNLLGVMLGSQRAARQMMAQGGGSIINTGSIGGILPGFGIAAYRASKAAVNHFSKCIAIEYAPYGIRVNCINPGSTETEMQTMPIPGMPAEVLQQLGREITDILMAGQPLKRRGMPADIAGTALFLASDRAAQITGQAIAVDGGHSAGDSTNYAAQMLEARNRALAAIPR